MSTKIQFRQHLRMRERKKKLKNYVFTALTAAICLIVIIFAVKAITDNIGRQKEVDSEFIFNGYVFPQPQPKNSDILIDITKDNGIKTAYLTFDDGPNNSVTLRILDILRRYNIKATFFAVGTLIEKNPDTARRIYDEGHLLANHSYSHNYSEVYADISSFMNQINHTQELIEKTTGQKNHPRIFRFPGGGYKSGTYGDIKQECKTELENNGYRYCDWNALTGDAESKQPTKYSIMQRLKSSSKNKEDIVILMHDALAKGITADTLPDIIEYLLDNGYVFDTLDNA